jgi:hypothetical protein
MIIETSGGMLATSTIEFIKTISVLQ